MLQPVGSAKITSALFLDHDAPLIEQSTIEPVTVGDALPDMPLFLTNDLLVLVPLEPTYQATWDASPEELRIAVETGVVPEPGAE